MKTSTGLMVTVDILAGRYEDGKECAANFRAAMRGVQQTANGFDRPSGVYRVMLIELNTLVSGS